MTYGMLRRRILALLDGKEEEMAAGGFSHMPETALTGAVNAAARKAALLSKCIYRRAALTVQKGADGLSAALPQDFISAKTLCRAGQRREMEFELVGGRIFLRGGEDGAYTLGYFAYPAPVDEETPGEYELDYDDLTADIVAYGTATELCHSLYPGDVKRYMRLATEFDERLLAAVPRSGEETVKNGVFGRRRGGFL